HMDMSTEMPKIDAIVDKLCDDYKSHGYQISRKEARSIGLKVSDATPDVEQALMDLLKFYTARRVAPVTVPKQGQLFMQLIAWLDSADLRYRVEAQYQPESDGTAKYLGDQW